MAGANDVSCAWASPVTAGRACVVTRIARAASLAACRAVAADGCSTSVSTDRRGEAG
jgi:hypothetical protein